MAATSVALQLAPPPAAARPGSGLWGRLVAAVRRVLDRSGRRAVAATAAARAAIAPMPPAPTTPTAADWAEVHRRVRDAYWSMRRPSPLVPTPPTEMQARELPWGDWQDHPGFGITIERIVTIFRSAEAGYPAPQCDLIDDLVEGDCHLRNLFDARRQAVAGKPFVIQAGGGDELDQQASRILSMALARLPLTQFWEHQLTFNTYGWAATEIQWGMMEAEGRTWIVPVWLVHVPARRFRIDPITNELRLVTATSPQGEQLRAGCWVITTRPGPLARASLMRTAAFPATYKRFANRDWVIYSHKFGLPLTLVKYGDENTPLADVTDDPSRQICEEIVENLGNDGGAVVPKSIDVQIEEAGRNADASGTHGSLIGQQNREMSKLVNGSTLATDNSESGQGSYAQANVHADVRWDNVIFDATRLEEGVELQIGQPFLVYNGLAGAAAAPMLSIQIAPDLSPEARVGVADQYVNKLGGRVSRSQLGQELGFRDPLNDADALPGAPKLAAPAAAPVKEAA
jgi:phage gp29-like protein